jgi:hypothetical protein
MILDLHFLGGKVQTENLEKGFAIERCGQHQGKEKSGPWVWRVARRPPRLGPGRGIHGTSYTQTKNPLVVWLRWTERPALGSGLGRRPYFETTPDLLSTMGDPGSAFQPQPHVNALIE